MFRLFCLRQIQQIHILALAPHPLCPVVTAVCARRKTGRKCQRDDTFTHLIVLVVAVHLIDVFQRTQHLRGLTESLVLLLVHSADDDRLHGAAYFGFMRSQRRYVPKRFFRIVACHRKIQGRTNGIDICCHGNRAVIRLWLLRFFLLLRRKVLRRHHGCSHPFSPRIFLHQDRCIAYCRCSHRDRCIACRLCSHRDRCTSGKLRHRYRRDLRCRCCLRICCRSILFWGCVAVRYRNCFFVSSEDQRGIEIDQADIAAVCDHHIARLDIAVNDRRLFAVFLMQILHHFTQLTRPTVTFLLRHRAVLFHILL